MKTIVTLCLGLLLLPLGPLTALSNDLDPLLLEMAGGRYKQAIARCDRLLAGKMAAEQVPLIRLLKARALLESGAPARAAKLAAELVQVNSPWSGRARFLRAEALLKLGRKKEAAEIYRLQLRELAGKPAMRKLASAYRKLAAGFSKDKPHQAAKLYQAAHAAEPDSRKLRDLAQMALHLQKAGDLRGADRRWSELLASKPLPADLRSEALYHRGLARLGLRPRWTHKLRRSYKRALDFSRARADFRSLLESDASSIHAARALYQLGKSFKPTQSRAGQSRAGIIRWQTLLDRFPKTAEARNASFELGMAWMARGDQQRAIQAFVLHRKRFPNDVRAGEAAFQIAIARRQQGKFDTAIMRFTDYLRAYPTGTRWQVARTAIEDVYYRKVGYAKKLDPLRDYLTRYPGGRYAARCLLQLGQLQVAQKAAPAGVATWRRLLARFPKTAPARQARLELAELAERTGQLEEAVKELEALVRISRKTTEGRQALSRLVGFRKTELVVITRRPFGLDQQRQIEVTVRNIETIELMAYRLDLKAYFEKHLQISTIEHIATEIIAPDKRWTHKIVSYQRFKQYKLVLPVPTTGAGAWIVEARTRSARGKTLLLVSNLQLILRGARREALAFVQSSGAPVAGVTVRLATDKRLLPVVKTDHQGIARVGWRPATRAIHAIAYTPDGQFAFTGLKLPRVKTGRLTPRGYVYTDRPLYRPGDRVHYRAIVRVVQGDQYRTPSVKTARVVVRDSRGVTLQIARRPIDRFGAISGTIALGAEPALGIYTIQVRVRTHDFSGTFWVEAYRVPPFAVELTARQGILFPGEQAEIELKARYRFGTDVSGAKVMFYVLRQPLQFDSSRYRDFAWFLQRKAKRESRSGPVVHRYSTTTDAQGRARLRYRLPQADRPYRYSIVARVSDTAGHQVHGATTIHAVLTGVRAIVKPERKAYRTGEQVKLRLITVLPDHRPIARVGRIQLMLDDQVIKSYAVRTGEDGQASSRFTVSKPGRYQILFSCEDRRGTSYQGHAFVDVAGKTRVPKLILRAEKTYYRQGQKARIHLTTPAPGLNVLLTFEAEGIVDHKILRVPGRAISFDHPLPASYAPNGYLTATVMHDNDLYSDRDGIVVLQYLETTVTTDRQTVRPGGELKLTLTTRDQQGRPIQAAVSCSIVDSGIYALRQDPAGPIKAFFYNRRRQHGVAGAGSVFRYHARRLSPLDLVTQERQQAQRELALGKLQKRLEGKILVFNGPDIGTAKKPRPKKNGFLHDEKNADAIGSAGGAGGKFGGRRGGRRTLRGYYGGSKANAQENASWSTLMNAAGISKMLSGLTYRRTFRDTAFWRASIVTDSRGRATVTVKMPDNLTRWRLTVRGASAGNHLGQGVASLVSRQPLLLQLRAPRYLIEGDRSSGTLELHNSTDRQQKTGVGFRVARQASKQPVRPDRELTVQPHSVARTPAEFTARGTGQLFLEASAVAAMNTRDALQRPLPVLPAGTRILRTGSGRLASSASRTILLPPRTDRRTARLILTLDPDPDRSLERALDDLRQYPYGCFEQTISRFLPAVAAIQAYQAMGKPNDRLRSRYLPIAESGLTRMYNMQNKTGGWGWWGKGKANPTWTAYGLLAFEMCQASGLLQVVPERLAAARRAAHAVYGQAGDNEKAFLLWAISYSGTVDRTRLGALYRRREALGPAALSLASLAAHRMRQAPLAAGFISLLLQRVQSDGSGLFWKGDGGFLSGTVESTALATLALATIQQDQPRCRQAVDYLMRQRSGPGWGSTKTSALCLLAISAARSLLAQPRETYTVTVTVNGQAVGKLTVKAGVPANRRLQWVIPADKLTDKNVVVLDKQGEGVLYFSYRLEAYRRGKVQPDGNQLTLRRRFRRAADPLGDRKAARPGQTILIAEKRSLRPIVSPKISAVGDLLRVELTLTALQDVDYVLLESPIPAGFVLAEGGRTGKADRFEARLDRVAFFFTRLRRGSHQLSYRIRALYPGRYTVNPARAELMYRPALYAHGASARLEVVRELDQKSRPKITPDELLAKAERTDNEALYLRLLALPLQVKYKARIARRLIRLRLTGGGERLVEAYELLHDAQPGAVLPFGQLAGVADAYASQERSTRALELYRMLYDRRLTRLTGLAGALRRANKPLAGQLSERSLLRSFPATPLMIAQSHRWATAYETVRDPRRHNLPRITDAIQALELQMALWPASPTSRLSSLRVMGLAERIGAASRASAEAVRYLKRYPKAPRRDAVLYALARNAFAAGQYPLADQAADRLSRAVIKAGNQTRPSPYRSYAIYLRAKIAHADGKLARAIQLYEKVQTTYPDAANAVRFYRRRALELAPVIRSAPGKPVRIAIRYRNLSAVKLSLYRVDLLTLFLMRKGRGTMDKVDLSGVKPTTRFERKLEPAPGFDLRARQLDLGRLKTGAYLMVLRGEAIERSAFVLVSKLEIRVQRRQGRIHVYAFSGGKPLGGVKVRIAAGGRIAARGTTDARGLFSHADPGKGAAVVAFKDKSYALWSSR